MASGRSKTPPADSGKKVDRAVQREERLAEALRQNLKRRKAGLERRISRKAVKPNQAVAGHEGTDQKNTVEP